MKKVLVLLVMVVPTLLVVMAVTKPDRTAHYEVLKSVVLSAVEAKVDEAVPEGSLRTVATFMALGTADEYLRKNLLVYDKTFYSKGVLVYNDYFIPVSIGVMGHVFLTFDEEDVDKLTKQVDLLKVFEKKDLMKLLEMNVGRH